MVCMRKNSRKQNARKNMRKNMRKNTRKNRRANLMYGGNPMQLSLAQGREFAEIHREQHGGGAPLMGAPVGYTGMLDESLRASARIGPLDASYAEVRGMSDIASPAVMEQKGGRRRRGTRKFKKASHKSKKASHKNYRKNRKMSGGSAPIDASFDLLSPSMRMKAGTADFSNPLLLK